MDVLPGLIAGICLAAARGFRAFLPLLGLGIEVLSGRLTLSSGFEWIGTWPALIAFATATVIEIGAIMLTTLALFPPVCPGHVRIPGRVW
jgi:hypothetical protein